jgi:hypothetical protein
VCTPLSCVGRFLPNLFDESLSFVDSFKPVSHAAIGFHKGRVHPECWPVGGLGHLVRRQSLRYVLSHVSPPACP